MSDLDLRERLARIEEMEANTQRKRQEIQYAPWQLLISAALGLLAAGAAIGALLVKVLGY